MKAPDFSPEVMEHRKRLADCVRAGLAQETALTRNDVVRLMFMLAALFLVDRVLTGDLPSSAGQP